MDTMLLRLYQRQVCFQCEAALLAAGCIGRSLADPANRTALWAAIQDLLTAAGNISKALWGVQDREKAKRERKRKPLRDSLGVEDDSVLKDVVVRNHFEHYDERLEKWWRKSKRHNHVDFGVMSRGAIQGVDEIDLFRSLDPETLEVVFWGDRFDLRAIVQAIRELLPVAHREAARPHWDDAK